MSAEAPLRIRVRRLAHGEGLPLPAYSTAGSSGLDLCAAVNAPLEIAAGARAQVPTGLCISIPPGYEGQVRPRSGLAWRSGLTVVNAPGTIDADYRGELCVLLVNLGSDPYTVQRGDRIAQLVIAPVCRAELEEARCLDATGRGTGGFGHTGVAAL